jgi:hypothetical protein
MDRRIARTLALAGLVISLLAGGTAAAIGPPGESRASTEAGDREDRREWRYDTYYLFPLTRHMDEAGIPPACRIPLYPFTVAFDLFQLPFGAIAGLFGD